MYTKVYVPYENRSYVPKECVVLGERFPFTTFKTYTLIIVYIKYYECIVYLNIIFLCMNILEKKDVKRFPYIFWRYMGLNNMDTGKETSMR